MGWLPMQRMLGSQQELLEASAERYREVVDFSIPWSQIFPDLGLGGMQPGSYLGNYECKWFYMGNSVQGEVLTSRIK